MNAIEVTKLRKTYPGGAEAVKGIDFEVRAGEVFGLLGPNGAGKTTTVEILEGLRPRTSENLNELVKALFHLHGTVPTMGHLATQRSVLGCIFVYSALFGVGELLLRSAALGCALLALSALAAAAITRTLSS